MHNPILSLRNVVQEAALAATPEKRAREIVIQVKAAMNAGVCSLYLAGDDGVLTLVATDGLAESAVGNIKLGPGEGLVGLIAQTQLPLNLESAREHPAFRNFPDSGEDRYESFLGVPIVHAGELSGVLVVERGERRRYSEDEESFLVTAAAHLGALSPSDFQPAEEGSERAGPKMKTPPLPGLAASPGIGIGTIVLLTDEADLLRVVDQESDDPAWELSLFRAALAATLEDLAQSKRQLASEIPKDLAEVFNVYQLLLSGDEFPKAVECAIGTGLEVAPALRTVVSDYVARFEAMDDEYFCARGEDIQALGSRIYSHLSSSSPREIGEGERIVLVGSLVSVAEIANYPIEQLAGIVCHGGSILSHTALLAKALGLPAVMGIGHQGELHDGELLIVDGYHGRVLRNPGDAVRGEYERLIEESRHFEDDLQKLRELPALTPDGRRIHLHANTGLLADITPGLSQGAEGIGLYRSEIPFLIRSTFPSEQEQREVYRQVLESYRGMPVSMRTLDVGGDKPLPYYPVQEENPALGWRGIRFSLDNRSVFMTQVRAMLLASAGLGNLRIMLPMVSRVEEVESFAVLLESACGQLAAEGFFIPRPPLGIMAEVPAVRSILPFVKGMIDFVSIGSNDLSQYVLAVDRGNARVAPLFDHLHPAVLEMVEEIVRRGMDLGLEVSVCGDMAADPCAVVLLLAMGVESLSMPAFSIPRIKWLLRTVRHDLAVEQLERARKAGSAEESRVALHDFLEAQGLRELLEPTAAGR